MIATVRSCGANRGDRCCLGVRIYTPEAPEEENILKHTLCRILVAIATFLIGTASQRVFDRHEVASPVPQSEFVRVTFQPPRPAEPEVAFDYDPIEFNPRGDYFILGRKPKEFREFDGLEIAVDEDKISGRVMISTYENGEYGGIYGISGVVTDRRISLVAKPVNEEDDFGYRFEGEFLRKGELWRAAKYEPVLKGRLSKTKGGETIAEAEVKFRIEYLGC